MIRWLRRNLDAFDYVICFSYRYWTTVHAMRVAAGKAILVPTAEPDPTIEVPLYHPVFRSARAIVYNSHEERSMIVRHAANDAVPGDVVGVGIVEPPPSDAARFRAGRGIDGPFVFYIGRIDRNKGCEQLFDYFEATWRAMERDGLEPPKLVLAGSAILDIPEHPGIVYLGRVSDEEKYDALGASLALIMPSFFESLSMVLLEAWALGRPVFVNAHCDVLEGQTIRAQGGLYYRTLGEFDHGLRLLAEDERLRDVLGANGRRYYLEHYRWPVIEEKYERILHQLAREDRE
jgi:glycosyltransferase involved in cell wall biosynthesis